MSSIIEQAYGTANLNLYEDVLMVPKDSSLAQLRKAYYKQALKYHPDKNSDEDGKLKFQAISWAYQLLKDPEKRADYDNDGVIPHDDGDDDEKGSGAWKDYFDLIFGKVTTSDIDEFSMKYKMSEEEEKDVLKHYEKFKGNLVKMLEFVMLSEERDVQRWMEDYIKPAIASGKVKDFPETLKKTMAQIQRKIEKGYQDDSEETETEESSDEEAAPNRRKKGANTKQPPKKAKPTKGKQKKSSTQDLIAAIRNKKGGTNPFASLGARYGVSMVDDDPLDDETFAKVQSKLKRK